MAAPNFNPDVPLQTRNIGDDPCVDATLRSAIRPGRLSMKGLQRVCFERMLSIYPDFRDHFVDFAWIIHRLSHGYTVLEIEGL